MSSIQKTSSNILRNTLTPFLRRSRPSRESFQSEMQNLQNVEVSTNSIKFQFRGAHNQYLYNRDLKITNNTGGKISFNIKSNNPENYQVVPCRQSLNNGKSCDIRIRLTLDNKNASKYNLDKFLVQWGRHEENERQVNYSQSRQIGVKVEQQNLNQRSVDCTQKEEQDLIMYNEMLQKNRKEIKKLDERIEELETSPSFFIIPKGLMLLVACISFLLGYFVL